MEYKVGNLEVDYEEQDEFSVHLINYVVRHAENCKIKKEFEEVEKDDEF